MLTKPFITYTYIQQDLKSNNLSLNEGINVAQNHPGIRYHKGAGLYESPVGSGHNVGP